jgi:hypothetical protein
MSGHFDALAREAQAEARTAKRWAWFWWANLPVVCVGYWLVSEEPIIEKFILVYLAAVSIIALAATYESKSKAAEAKAAGYENP